MGINIIHYDAEIKVGVRLVWQMKLAKGDDYTATENSYFNISTVKKSLKPFFSSMG